MWPSALSGRLCIVALVGRYLTNQLMHRRSIHVHGQGHFNSSQMLVCYLSGFSIRFQKLSRAHGQVTYVLLTRSPLDSGKQAFLPLVRLACVRHAASVHPEPGSNSPLYIMSLAPKINRAISSQETLQTDRVNCNPTPDSGQTGKLLVRRDGCTYGMPRDLARDTTLLYYFSLSM